MVFFPKSGAEYSLFVYLDTSIFSTLLCAPVECGQWLAPVEDQWMGDHDIPGWFPLASPTTLKIASSLIAA